MAIDPGISAWQVLRRQAAYLAEWRASAAAPSLELAPFPLRVQSETDLAAAAWRLLAWQNPASDDAASPFWIGAPVLEGAVRLGARPLAEMASAPGAGVEGLRLLDGGLLLKIARGGRVVRLLLRGVERFPAGAGVAVVHDFGLRIPHTARWLYDFWAAAGEPAPPPARSRAMRGIWPRWTGFATA